MTSKIKLLDKKKLVFSFVGLLAITAIIVTVWIVNKNDNGELLYNDPSQIAVSNAEMEEYRSRIGSDMDVKKAILILFENEETCREFIKTHGADESPEMVGEGIIPLMEDGYYNIVGKQSIEEAFDALRDGEYSSEPIIYSGLYCYLKRIGVESPVKDDKMLKELIQYEKYQEMRKVDE